MLFAVWPPWEEADRPQAVLDPVVLLKDGGFRLPSSYTTNDKGKSVGLIGRFANQYYEFGRKYSLLDGGTQHGTLKILTRTNLGCVPAPAVEATPAVETWRMELSPSVVGPPLRLHADWRSPVTAKQRSMLVNLAMDYLQRRKIPKLRKITVSPREITIEHSVATKLDNSNDRYVIASVVVRQPKATHHLFMVALEHFDWYVPVLVSAHLNQHLPGNDNLDETLVGQLDLDGDGMDELITVSWHAGSWNYTIYKRLHGKWRRVYKGGGASC